MDGEKLCEDCRAGYHAPFDRFERIAVHPDGPTFLQCCKRCGTLWHEGLHDARIVSPEEAKLIYPDAPLP
jgi:hypothetical protein